MLVLNRNICFFLLLLSLNSLLAQQERPNIIVVLTDDQRWDALGAMGNSVIQTPNLDKLAWESSLFQNAFVTTPICAASRASIMTGLYERKHQFTFRTPPLKTEFIHISYPKLLKDAGYRVGFFGKFGMNFEHNAQDSIFDAFDISRTDGYFRLRGEGWSEHVHLTDLTTDKAIEFLDKLDGDAPFCVSISYNAPHADDTNPRQYVWPERNNTLYDNAPLPEISLTQKKYHEALPDLLKDSLYMGNIRYKWRFDTEEKAEEMIKGYYRMITTIDQNIGKLRDFLEQKNLTENTVIIFLGDNGYFLGERQLAGKWLMYENSLRVPLIVHDPSAPPRTHTNMALNIDVSPTVLEYAKIPIPGTVQGKSLLSAVKQGNPLGREAFLCEHLYDIPYIPKSEGIRTDRYKYFRYVGTSIEELYDLSVDPLEINNLAHDEKYADLKARLSRRTSELIAESQN